MGRSNSLTHDKLPGSRRLSGSPKLRARHHCSAPARVDAFRRPIYYSHPQNSGTQGCAKIDPHYARHVRRPDRRGRHSLRWRSFLTLTGAPAFYQAAVDRDPALLEVDNDKCLQQAAALASDLQSPGPWEAIFSADQINGWLAVDLARNYGESLPPQIQNPRIDFHSGAATLACTYRSAGHETVMSIAFDLYLSQPNVVALRLRRVRAGLLPVPLADVLRVIDQAGRGFGLMVEWRQVGGDPVALVHLSHAIDDEDGHLQLEAIELREGEIYIAGRTHAPLAGRIGPPR